MLSLFIVHCVLIDVVRAGDLMQDLKTGHLLGTSPRAQFFAQLVGSSVSIIVTTIAYNFYTRAYSIPGPQFPAPTAYVWLGLARLLRKRQVFPIQFSSYLLHDVPLGEGDLPEKSGTFMVVFAIVFGLVSAVKSYSNRRQLPYSKWIPSGIAFAIGFLNTPSFSLARLLGGVVEYVYNTRYVNDGGRDIRLVTIASGFVLGEGVMSVVELVLRTFRINPASCWGCHGLCPGCSTR
jgi:uncharacterized oligopeptide transporter (OPT) family protein